MALFYLRKLPKFPYPVSFFRMPETVYVAINQDHSIMMPLVTSGTGGALPGERRNRGRYANLEPRRKRRRSPLAYIGLRCPG